MDSNKTSTSPAAEFRLRLASESPRRSELLRLTGWGFHTAPSSIDESSRPGEAPWAMARRLAREKAEAALPAPGEWVLAADTVVVDGDQALGKPTDPADAERMLMRLEGKEHLVLTALALVHPVSGVIVEEICATSVSMRSYSREEVRAYVATGAWSDKAGGYGIQDPSFRPVDGDRMRGCYANVMGLPLCHLARAARALGVEPPTDVPVACTTHLVYDCPVFPAILRGEL